MAMNLRADNTFVQDEGWYIAAGRYDDFVRRHEDTPVLYLELGVGLNTPGIIKYNFWQQVYQNQKAQYVCVNKGQSYAPQELAGRSFKLWAKQTGALSADTYFTTYQNGKEVSTQFVGTSRYNPYREAVNDD